jgi:hypothetical protein
MELCWAKLDSPVFPDRTKLNRKELGLQVLIDISPPLSLSTKKVLEKSSRSFTHRRHHLLHIPLLLHHHHEFGLEEGIQMEEDEMRMPRPGRHSQSRSR